MENTLTLSNFINNLIQECFNGILLAELETERAIDELKLSCFLSNEEFAEKFLSKEIIRSEILNLFAKDNDPSISLIDEKQPYIPPSKTVIEIPKIKVLTDYSMIENIDYVKSISGFAITAKGYYNIYTKVLNNMVIRKKFFIQELIKKGLPTIELNSGNINTKVLIENPKDEFCSNNIIRGLKYELYIKEQTSNKLIFNGISNNLKIPEIEFSKCSFASLDGFIYIEQSNYYTFIINSNDIVYLSINNIFFNPLVSNKIFLDKGLKTISIIYENKLKKAYSLTVYFTSNSLNNILVDDNFLFYTNEHTSTIKSALNFNSPNTLNIKTLKFDTIINNNFKELTSTIELNYTILRK